MAVEGRRRLRRGALALVLFLVSAAAAEAIWIAWRTRPLYQRVAAGGRGWRGRVHAAHPELGFAPIPGAGGAHTFPIGPDVPMRYDERGFRVPADQAGAGRDGARWSWPSVARSPTPTPTAPRTRSCTCAPRSAGLLPRRATPTL